MIRAADAGVPGHPEVFECNGLLASVTDISNFDVRAGYGSMRNFLLLLSFPLGVVTVKKPVVACSGTVAKMRVSDIKLNFAATPLKETAVVPVKPCPRTLIIVPTLAA